MDAMSNTDAQLYCIYYQFCIMHISIGSPVHGKCVVDSLNATDKSCLTIFITTVQISGATTNGSQIVMHTKMINIYIILARVFQK